MNGVHAAQHVQHGRTGRAVAGSMPAARSSLLTTTSVGTTS